MQEYESKLSAKNSAMPSPEDSPEVHKLLTDPETPTLGKRSGFQKGFSLRIKNARFTGIKDIWRVMDSFAGQDAKLRQYLDEKIIKPLEKAKARYAFTARNKARQFRTDMERLGIKAGSRESAAIMWIGEGKRQTGKVKTETGFVETKTEPYTMEMLKKDFPNNWENILEAEKLIRKSYNEYIERINDMLEKVYPNAGKKEVEKLENLKKRYSNKLMQKKLYTELRERVKDEIKTHKDRLSKTRNTSKVYAEIKMRIRRAEQKSNDILKQIKNADQLIEQMQKDIEEQQNLIQKREHLKNKRLTPRKDYFMHMQELETGFSALKNIIGGNFEIDPKLAAISEETKPKSKWTSFMQHRGKGGYVEDAVSGMAEYIKLAEAKIEIDPLAAYYRDVVEDVVEQTGQSRNANAFIDFMTQYTNGLLGKTNRLDRVLQAETGRRFMKFIAWLNNRVKLNAVVGNVSSAIAQFFNYQNVAGYIKNPTDLAYGAFQHLRYFAQSTLNKKNIHNNRAAQLLESSPFLTERYLNNEFEVFDGKKHNTPKKITSWMLEFGDKWVAQSGWLSAYRQGVRKKVADPVTYADDIIRRSVGGRGIGELSLHQQSNLVKLLAPFTVEVHNAWNVMAEQTKNRDFAGLMINMLIAFLLNGISKALTGRSPSADPIGAMVESIKSASDPEDERNAFEKTLGVAKRFGGELLSNAPYVNFILPLMIANEDERQAVFGESDPSRYGTGNIGVTTVLDPLVSLLSGKDVDLLEPALKIAMPGGGAQLHRTITATQDMKLLPDVKISSKGISFDWSGLPVSETPTGNYRFMIDTSDPLEVAKAMLFGVYSTESGKRYIQGEAYTLGEELYQSIKEGDTKKSTSIQKEMKTRYRADGKTEKEAENAIDSSIKKALREHDDRVKEAAKAKFEGDIYKYKRLLEEITRSGFAQELVVDAITSEMNKLDEGSEENEDNAEIAKPKYQSIYSSDDLNKTLESGNQSYVTEIITDMMKAKSKNAIQKYLDKGLNARRAETEAQKDAKTAIRSQLTRYWKPIYQEASAEEKAEIRRKLYFTKMYQSLGDIHETLSKK